jgi:hypothetical protein
VRKVELFVSIGLALLGIAASVLITQGQNTWLPNWPHLGLWLLIAAVLFFLASVRDVPPIRKFVYRLFGVGSLPARMLFEEADLLHRLYRNLDQQFGEEAQYPLLTSSWPNYGQPWEYVHVSLFCLNNRLRWMGQVGGKVFKEMGWASDSVELFHLNDRTTMVDVLHALEGFRHVLRSKFRAGV